MGNLRGHKDTRCKEHLFPDGGSQCSPNVIESLKEGDIIDFTFATDPTTGGYFVFYITGS